MSSTNYIVCFGEGCIKNFNFIIEKMILMMMITIIMNTYIVRISILAYNFLKFL